MTTYSYTMGSTPSDFNGNTKLVEKMVVSNTDAQSFSEDAVTGGAQVVTAGGRYKTISSVQDLDPTDLVTIGGIEMTVKMARMAGYSAVLEELADKSAKAVQKHSVEGQPVPEPELTFTQKEAMELENRVASGLASYEEVNAGETIAATFAMHAGLPKDEAQELVTDLLTGNLPEHDPVWQALGDRGMSREGTHAMVNQAVGIGRAKAERELGANKFNELQRMSERSATINNLVLAHGMARARGKTNLSWNDIYNVAKQHEAE